MRGRAIVAVACAAEFLVVLDASVVNVALPAIRDGLGFSSLGLHWVVNAYALVFAGFLLLGGRLADVWGARRVFVVGLAVFVGASAVGGAAPNAGVLVGARALQALGAAALAPASLTVLTMTFPEGPRRTKALALWTAVASAGGAAGSLIGGVLTAWLTWRATLFVNVPIGILAGIVAARVLVDTHRGSRIRLDVPGAVAVTCAVAALAYGVSSGPVLGWVAAPVLAGFAVAGIGLAAFGLIETRWAASPLLPLRLLRVPAVGIGNVAMLLAGGCLMPVWFMLSLVMQQGLGLSPFLTGVGFLPHTLTTVAVGARVAPWLLERFTPRSVVVAGCLIGAAGFAWQATLNEADTYVSGLLGPAIVLSVGGGLLNTPLTALVTSGAVSQDSGAASGLMNTTKQVGGALGLAVALAVASAAAGGRFDAGVSELMDGAAAAFLAMCGLLVVVAAVTLLIPTRTSAPSCGGESRRMRRI